MPKINAISVIKRDHRAVNIAYKKYKGTRAAPEREKIARKIFDALERHVEMEEELFYPAVAEEGNAKAQSIVEASLAEHTEMKTLISRFQQEVRDLGFGMKLDELMAGVMHHVKEEESELLPEVKKSMRTERLEELGEEMDKRSPSAGQSTVDQLTRRVKAEAKALTS